MIKVGFDLLRKCDSQRNQEEYGANCCTAYRLHVSLLFACQECTRISKHLSHSGQPISPCGTAICESSCSGRVPRPGWRRRLTDLLSACGRCVGSFSARY